ncbi:hypothetical protein WICPIJ_000445 [Wickerhamomyces pijperi]|uniref:Kinetochore protein NDC80 n=1 Tax=Wickerhamomyces pijperi TaxID=599730 RepID=A0A9P8TS12_WICPI|nr:hypothetical protein WICPIJ_000445 [Wickerhamomyces pijperi]
MSQEHYYNSNSRLARRESTRLASTRDSDIHRLNNNNSNSNNNNHGTAIQPSSTISKRSSRISAARQSLTGATRISLTNPTSETVNRRKSTIGLTDLIQQSVARTNTRKSLIPTVTTTNPNSMTPIPSRTNKRTSSFGLNAMMQSQAQRDPRPLRDRNYQQNIQQEILHYLNASNFEHEMKHAISSKSLRNPTQRDFVLMFQFLMKEIDPSYRFVKSVELEVYSALKLIKYPYLETVSRSQISAVGGQNWPVFLGIIHYLVGCCTDLKAEMDMIDNLVDLGLDQEEDADEAEVEDEDDKIFAQNAMIFRDYLDSAYELFMNEEDDFDALQEEMSQRYAALVEDHKAKIQEFEKEGRDLLVKYQDAQKEMDTIEFLERKKTSLTDDLEKLRVYIASLTNRKQKWAEVLRKMKEEKTRVMNQIETFDKEKEEIFKSLENQGVSPTEIDQILIERERTSKAIDECVTIREEQLKLFNLKQTTAEQLYGQLQELLKSYNQSIYTISASVPEHDYTVFQLKLDNLLTSDRVGLKTDVLLPSERTQQIQTRTQEIQTQLKEKLRAVDEQTMTLQEQNELLWEKLGSLDDQMDQLEIRKQKLGTEIVILNDNLANDTTSYNAEIERYQQEIKDLETHLTNTMTISTENVNLIDKEYVLEKARMEREIRELQQSVNYNVMSLLQFKGGIEAHADSLMELVEEEMNLQVKEMESADL